MHNSNNSSQSERGHSNAETPSIDATIDKGGLPRLQLENVAKSQHPDAGVGDDSSTPISAGDSLTHTLRLLKQQNHTLQKNFENFKVIFFVFNIEQKSRIFFSEGNRKRN